MASNMDIILVCRGCGADTPLKNLRYDAQKRLVCGNCQDRGKSLPDPLKEIRQKMQRKIKAQDIIDEQPKTPKKTPYTCKRCNYRFSITKLSSYTLRCPFCGREDYIQKNDEFTTARLIREVSTDRF